MAKKPNTAIGIDIGRYASKAVLIQRRGNNRFAITRFGVHMSPAGNGKELLEDTLKALLANLKASAKACSVALSTPESLVRIIEQPETPTEILRNALRLNGMSMLNQEVKNYVLDCALIPLPAEETAPPGQQRQYLVGGLPRTQIQELEQAADAARLPVSRVQLGPVALFNSFEFAKPDIFSREPFILVDMGHSASTVTVGVKGHLVLVRSIEYGGGALVEALKSLQNEPGKDALKELEEGDHLLLEAARMSLGALTREVSSSIGFFEARRDETISHIFVSGGPARSQALLNLMSEELRMPCEAWHPFEHCEIAVEASRKSEFAKEAVNLNLACGAAIELLRNN